MGGPHCRPHRVGQSLDRGAERADLGAQTARPDRGDGRVDVGVTGVVGAGRRRRAPGSRRSRSLLQVVEGMRLNGQQHARAGRHGGLRRSQLVADAPVGARVEHLSSRSGYTRPPSHRSGRAARPAGASDPAGPVNVAQARTTAMRAWPDRDDLDRSQPRWEWQRPVSGGGRRTCAPPSTRIGQDRGRPRVLQRQLGSV